jgi:hypothetical protein
VLQNSGVIVDLGVAPKGTEESALIATSRSRAFLGGWVAVMAIGDVIGSLCIGLIVYSAYVSPLENGSTQLWVGLLGFLFARGSGRTDPKGNHVVRNDIRWRPATRIRIEAHW